MKQCVIRSSKISKAGSKRPPTHGAGRSNVPGVLRAAPGPKLTLATEVVAAVQLPRTGHM